MRSAGFKTSVWCFGFSTQVPIKPLDRATKRIDLILPFSPTVPFLGVIMSRHRVAFSPQGIYDLLGFFLRNTDVVLALQQRKGGLFLRQVLQYRTFVVYSRISFRITKKTLHVFLDKRVGVRQHRAPVRDPVLRNPSRPHIWHLANGHHCHQSAVRPARDSDTLAMDETGVLYELGGVDLVLKIPAPDILVICPLKSHPVPGRTPYVRSYADVPPRGERDRCRVPAIESLPHRAAMCDHDSRTGSVSLQVERNPQNRADPGSIETLVVNNLRWRHVVRIKRCDPGMGQLSRGIRS